MKFLATFALVLLSIIGHTQTNLTIAPNQSIQLNYPTIEDLAIEIKNLSNQPLDITTIQTVSGEQLSGFGLAPKGRATIAIHSLALLQISNNTSSKAEIAINPISLPAPEENPEDLYISFTLRNETAQSIPLIIPGVMNPNLSPFSNSGVRLKIGQQINFRQGLKTYTLLTVSPDVEEGAFLEIGALLKEKKIELGLK
ncbi:MAG: hypothetical protein PVK00_03665 [Flavobacteriales bacterium]|jgi:hypothetical protein